jgi:hypothetical protein
MHYGMHEQLRGPMLQNEQRIKELAEQSGLMFERDYLRYEELLFAELIIRKCAELVEYNLKNSGRDIRKHFEIIDK